MGLVVKFHPPNLSPELIGSNHSMPSSFLVHEVHHTKDDDMCRNLLPSTVNVNWQNCMIKMMQTKCRSIINFRKTVYLQIVLYKAKLNEDRQLEARLVARSRMGTQVTLSAGVNNFAGRGGSTLLSFRVMLVLTFMRPSAKSHTAYNFCKRQHQHMGLSGHLGETKEHKPHSVT